MNAAALQVYVALLEEGTNVWRPVSSIEVRNGEFELLGPVPADECWQFGPGTVVRCSRHIFSNGEIGLVAFESVL